MSFVIDQVRRIDGQLDRLHFSQASSAPLSPVVTSSSNSSEPSDDSQPRNDSVDLTRVLQLNLAIKRLSTTASPRAILRPTEIQAILGQAYWAAQSPLDENRDIGSRGLQNEQELEWFLVSKATVQTYGLVLNALLEQTIPLSGDIWYWDEVLASYVNTGIYSIQTSPWRLWQWSQDIYEDAWRRLQAAVHTSEDQPTTTKLTSLSSHWKQFYGVVKDSVRQRSLADLQNKAISPLTRCRTEARKKQSHLRRFRETSACGLGVLVNEGLSFDVADDGSISSKSRLEEDKDEWRIIISKSVALMEAVIYHSTVLELGTSEFEETVFSCVDNDREIRRQVSREQQLHTSSAMIASRLQNILRAQIPMQAEKSQNIIQRYGRPSRLVRYWLPAVALILSSTTLLRIFVNRKAQIISWVRELGATTTDFWYNWIVDPVKKVIGTIRHDEGSEIAIMSKESLEGDRASLERMVIDFARDTHTSSTETPLSEAELASIGAKVREGDLTPVLRAYEKDLRNPFRGTISGDLIRTLLIQIQKTKVDVEVALGGIDALLKSQELVFGFVGLTPGILVCLGVSRWLSGAIRGRGGGKKGEKQIQMTRVLRNIDRILSASGPGNNGGMLSNTEHGMVLCQVHVLRQRAQRILPGDIYAELLEEIDDLVNIRTGVERQMRVVGRIQWAYSKWLK